MSSYEYHSFDSADPAVRRRQAISQAQSILRRAGVKAEIVVKTPSWQPGDVVVVRHDSPTSTPYTYVRGQKGWPGERYPKTDAQIDSLYQSGLVTPVLQSGGVPFDPSRLP